MCANISYSIREVLYQRLRREPIAHAVPRSLPVLFFGDLFSARIATVGINPSRQEYIDPAGHELTGSARRFETLTSLNASTREALTDEQCHQAVVTMSQYFHPGKPVYQWFRPLDRLTQAMDYSYVGGSVVHLDLIQETTDPTWSEFEKLYPSEASRLMVSDRPFLRSQLQTFSLRMVVCNGMTPLRGVYGLLDQPPVIETTCQGRIGGVNWYATHGRVGGRALAVGGWNIPLSRPSGLTDLSKEELGRKLALALDVLTPEAS